MVIDHDQDDDGDGGDNGGDCEDNGGDGDVDSLGVNCTRSIKWW